jgi:hypothetical protein
MLTALKWRCGDSLGDVLGHVLIEIKVNLLPECELISEVTIVSDHVAKTNAIANTLLQFFPNIEMGKK